MVIRWMAALPLVLLGAYVPACAQSSASNALPTGASTPLPTSKFIHGEVPGSPQRLNSLPMGVAWSPDHRYLALVNAGYGTVESNYEESIAILDTQTGKLTDNPDPRFVVSAPQTLYNGVAFSSDGLHLYVSSDSLSAPDKQDAGHTGNGILVYSFAEGKLTPERIIAIPLQPLAHGRKQNSLGNAAAEGMAIPAPTGIAVIKTSSGDRIVVADELSDDALLLDAASGRIIHRFDLADHDFVPSTYPISVAASRDGHRAWVGLWNGSAVAELDLQSGRVLGRLPLMPPEREIDPSSHPVSLALSPNEQTLYIALANRDSVAAVSLQGHAMHLAHLYDTRLHGQSRFGAMPDGIAVSPDGRSLYVANSGSNAVAVIHLHGVSTGVAGFLPTQWYTSAVAADDAHIYVATAKGTSTEPNDRPQPPAPDPSPYQRRQMNSPSTYIATMLHGSLATINRDAAEHGLREFTRQTIADNMMDAAQKHIAFALGGHPIRHVIYIIKENRTYDQIFGDLGVGDGDSSLTMYGKRITPNLHQLALQFGVLDNFYDSGEVSGDGHVWSNAAITSDYTEREWQQSYRGRERTYDFEGVVANAYPIQEGISDIDSPESGYIWTDLEKHGKTLYHFGEFISTKFCDDPSKTPKNVSPQLGTPEPMHFCAHPFIRKGERIPANYGGGASPYPWPIPLIYKDIATMPELQGHFDPEYPDFNLRFPDQLRVNEFLTHFRKWVDARKEGEPDILPDFINLRLGNDHTAGTVPGSPTPRASVADNDLAVGRVVEAISHSPYWEDTAILVLEDDAQNGADHVDAHRSIALVISKYAPRNQQALVDHTFYTTVSMLRTIEDLLGIPPMNNNDSFAPPIASVFQGRGDQPTYTADYGNRENGLIYTANQENAYGAHESSMMDFRHEDRADPAKLNVILWKDAMGGKPVPRMLLHPHIAKDDDDKDGGN